MDKNAATSAFQNAIETHIPAFETFFLAKLFGARISYAAESCIVDIPVNDFMFNPQGSLHGGVIAFALDVSMGHLIHHVTKRAAVTLEMKTQYMRPAVSGCVRCEARFLKRGRTVSFLESSMTDSEGKIVAAATATWQMPREWLARTSAPLQRACSAGQAVRAPNRTQTASAAGDKVALKAEHVVDRSMHREKPLG